MSRCLLRASLCTVCGAPRLGEDVTELGALAPHAPTAPTERVRAAHPGEWPTCLHGALYRAGCRNQPVLPACCCAPSPLLPSVPVHLEVP
ncbi:hypothetical protein LXT21_41655 [Myxococcus sp. K38C18041901]|uniref:hypothetical protein n=1 Tax=Myxococcus guangdongensis TaxID=2906760 RepID=UPI0020A71454|nr:hypothetical protein [Myxococcus guangdongensis]MCP3065298.1 hypothetical protein [Myxococcus guangdongensis]